MLSNNTKITNKTVGSRESTDHNKAYFICASFFHVPYSAKSIFLLLLKKITIPYLHDKMKFNILTALADICLDVDWRNKKTF